jgi:copper oxidase (laccase) domain-containing protein
MKKLGAKNIVAQVGPMIQQKSYEVSGDFFRDFLSEKSGNEKFFIPNKNDLEEKYLFDLPSYINEKLSQENLAEIKISPIDTYTNSAKFFSFRRSTHLKETDCGRNISVIEIS